MFDIISVMYFPFDWFHWWRHNGNLDRAYCNTAIVMQRLCSHVPGSPCDMGNFNLRPLIRDLNLDPKFNISDILRYTHVIQQLPHQKYEHQCNDQEITLILTHCFGDGYFISYGYMLHCENPTWVDSVGLLLHVREMIFFNVKFVP